MGGDSLGFRIPASVGDACRCLWAIPPKTARLPYRPSVSLMARNGYEREAPARRRRPGGAGAVPMDVRELSFRRASECTGMWSGEC